MIRRRRLDRLSVLAAALLLGGCVDDETSAPARNEAAVVAFVGDGDSLTLRDGRRVRLLQVDAPERRECHYRASARMLARLLPPGSRVELERDGLLDAQDEHGRLLRYVHARGRNVNLTLVEAGSAAPYFFRGERGVYAAALLRKAERALAARRGLWACPGARLEPGLGAVTR